MDQTISYCTSNGVLLSVAGGSRIRQEPENRGTSYWTSNGDRLPVAGGSRIRQEPENSTTSYCTSNGVPLPVAGGSRIRQEREDTTIFYWISNDDLLGPLRLAATDAGLCKLALGRESDDAFYAWLARVMRPPDLLHRRTQHIERALAEIQAYLSGRLRSFKTPLDLRGTPFQRRVWAEVRTVHYGATVTYGEIARRIGHRQAARAVGAANGANPVPLFVPCHRVIGAGGALHGYGGGLEIKAALLDLERSSPMR